MIYELRTYEAMPGKLPALNRRFAEITMGYFKKHGLNPVGFWTEDVGRTCCLGARVKTYWTGAEAWMPA